MIGREMKFALVHFVAVWGAIFFGQPTHLLAVQNEVSSEENAEQLVLQLADESPVKRRLAEQAIVGLGDAAVPALRRGLRSGNVEVHDRCRILLQVLAKTRTTRRKTEFLELPAGSKALETFKAWPEFCRFVGRDDATSRGLFVELCESFSDVFNDFGLRGELKQDGFQKAARLLLMSDREYAPADRLIVAYLFLIDQSQKNVRADGTAYEPELKAVELLEAVQFLVDDKTAKVLRQSAYREIVDRVVANWVLQAPTIDRLPAENRWNLIYQSGNAMLIDRMSEDVESFRSNEKLKFLDVVRRVLATGNDDQQSYAVRWLLPMLEDDSVVTTSRLRNFPAKRVELSVRSLALGTAAKFYLESSGERENDVAIDEVFGVFPLSNQPFAILRGEKSQQTVVQWLRTRQNGENGLN